MFVNIFYGLITMAVCLLLESLLLLIVLKYYINNNYIKSASKSIMKVLNVVMVILVLGNLLQIGIWGTLFIILDEFQDFATAFYHSAVNFATLGYGDIVMSDKHKLLGALEAINGVLMIGVSTAVLMSTIQDSIKKLIKERYGDKMKEFINTYDIE